MELEQEGEGDRRERRIWWCSDTTMEMALR